MVSPSFVWLQPLWWWQIHLIIIPSFLVDKGFFLPLRLSCKERLFSKTYPSFLTLKEGSTSHLGLLSSGEKKETALLGARNRYALRLADHQRSSPCCAGWDRQGTTCYNLLVETTIFVPHCSIALHLSPLEWGILFFILLLRGLLLDRYPSGLWRKSYDRHWHLMNDHSDRGYHLW